MANPTTMLEIATDAKAVAKRGRRVDSDRLRSQCQFWLERQGKHVPQDVVWDGCAEHGTASDLADFLTRNAKPLAG